jgi:hypothetical protein
VVVHEETRGDYHKGGTKETWYAGVAGALEMSRRGWKTSQKRRGDKLESECGHVIWGGSGRADLTQETVYCHGGGVIVGWGNILMMTMGCITLLGEGLSAGYRTEKS